MTAKAGVSGKSLQNGYRNMPTKAIYHLYESEVGRNNQRALRRKFSNDLRTGTKRNGNQILSIFLLIHGAMHVGYCALPCCFHRNPFLHQAMFPGTIHLG
ncbi:hypothetical protein TI05_13465 [Achromatium sp. WMS3]|nr:hypothetical protein TI05_13465 [Achromatium sp. WMS3]